MARRFNMATPKALAQAPVDEAANWLVGAEDSVTFLKANAKREEIVIYVSGQGVLIHGVLAPAQQVTLADYEYLMRGFVQTHESWAIQKSYGGGERHKVWHEPPTGCCALISSGWRVSALRRSTRYYSDSGCGISQFPEGQRVGASWANCDSASKWLRLVPPDFAPSRRISNSETSGKSSYGR